jgi:site-specific DNA-cytosine methylase
MIFDNKKSYKMKTNSTGQYRICFYSGYDSEDEIYDDEFGNFPAIMYTGDVAPGKYSVTIKSKITEQYRIRKLTPRECWRLMGVKDEQFDKLHDISNSQLYKMAGNSIVVDVLMGIFKNMFEPTEQKGQMELI